MSITYADIRKKHEQIEIERAERAELVLLEAQNLVDAYQISLGLKKDTWTDYAGLEAPYVFIGKKTDDHFKKSSLNSIGLNDKYGIDFTIATVIDDSPHGGSLSGVEIHLRIKDTRGTISVLVGADSKEFNVSKSADKYKKVCEEIKAQVLLSENDPALKLEEPTKTTAVVSEQI
jgi:hypothetical protein